LREKGGELLKQRSIKDHSIVQEKREGLLGGERRERGISVERGKFTEAI